MSHTLTLENGDLVVYDEDTGEGVWLTRAPKRRKRRHRPFNPSAWMDRIEADAQLLEDKVWIPRLTEFFQQQGVLFAKKISSRSRRFAKYETRRTPLDISKVKDDATARAEAMVNAVFDEEAFEQELIDAVEDLYGDVYDTALASTGVAMGIDFALGARDDVARLILARSKQLAGRVSASTYKQIQRALVDGIAEGKSIPELASLVQQAFQTASVTRATKIARTEVISAYNGAVFAGAEGLGIATGLQWMAARDERTRPAHASADGQVVSVGTPFIVGGEELRYPGDPNGSRKNTINCRCAVAILTDEDERSVTSYEVSDVLVRMAIKGLSYREALWEMRGDKDGHPFRGNQWNVGAGGTPDAKALMQQAIDTNTADAMATIHNAARGYVDLSAIADDLDLDTIKMNTAKEASALIQEKSQATLVRDGFAEEFIVYRGDAGGYRANQVVRVTPQKDTAQRFAGTRYDDGTGSPTAYKVKRSDVLTYAKGVNPYDSFASELEMHVDSKDLVPIDESRSATHEFRGDVAGHPFRGNQWGAKQVQAATRAALVAHLKENGYAGPISYTMARLRQIADAHLHLPAPSTPPPAPTKRNTATPGQPKTIDQMTAKELKAHLAAQGYTGPTSVSVGQLRTIATTHAQRLAAIKKRNEEYEAAAKDKATADAAARLSVREALQARGIKYVEGQDRSTDPALVEAARSAKLHDEGYSHGDLALARLAQEQGFDGLPKVVSKTEFEAMSARGEFEVLHKAANIADAGVSQLSATSHLAARDGSLYRGVSGGWNKSELEMTDDFRHGTFYAGTGVSGNGTYTSTRRRVAAGYSSSSSRDDPKNLLRMALRKGAKVTTTQESYRALGEASQKWRSEQAAKNPNATPFPFPWNNVGHFNTARGYDAMYTDDSGHVIVYNRTALIVQQEDG